MIDFIVANYIYFLIGFAVLVLIIIGFIAEKTDFGHKKKAKKQVVENTPKEEIKPVVADIKAVTEIKEVIEEEKIAPLPQPEEIKEELSFGDLNNEEVEEPAISNEITNDEDKETQDFTIINSNTNEELDSIAKTVTEADENKEDVVIDLSKDAKVEDVSQNVESKEIIPLEEDIPTTSEVDTKDNSVSEDISNDENAIPDDYYAKDLPEIKATEDIKPEVSKFELPSIGEPEKGQQIEEEDNLDDVWKF